MKKVLLLAAVCLALLAPSRHFPLASGWEIFPSIHIVNALVRVGDDLWGATNSGLFRFHLPSETFQLFTTAEGLSCNQIDAMVADQRGNLILGMDNVYIDVFDLSTHQVSRIPDFKLNAKIFNFYALYEYDGDVFVGTDVGVSRLAYFDDLAKYLIEGNYQNLGTFTTETTARSIHVFQDGLWVGTDVGLARGDLTQPFLESPENWTNFTVAEGLSSDEIRAFETYHDSLYVAAVNGLNRLTNLEAGFAALSISSANNASFLKVNQDTLYMGRANGLYRVAGNTTVSYGDPDACALCLEFSPEGTLWTGMITTKLSSGEVILGGLKVWDGQAWIRTAPEGPLVETVNDIAVEPDGALWVPAE